MLRTPIKNSKNVNKPFKSPFNSQIHNKEKSVNNKSLKQDCNTTKQSTQNTRNLEAKRILLLDEDEKEKKKRKITNDEIEKIQAAIPQNVTKTDLHALKRKIFEIRQELNSLKSRESCAKKHNPTDLRISINKWKEACQTTLQILCSELKERNGQNSKISDILNMLGIPEAIVHYSEKDDAFI